MFHFPTLISLFALAMFNISIYAHEANFTNNKSLSLAKSSLKVTLITGCSEVKKDNKPQELLNNGSHEECYDGCSEMRRLIITGEKGKNITVKIYYKETEESQEDIRFMSFFGDFPGKLELASGKNCELHTPMGPGMFIEVRRDNEIVFNYEIIGIGCM
jgi:hypothetical protein